MIRNLLDTARAFLRTPVGALAAAGLGLGIAARAYQQAVAAMREDVMELTHRIGTAGDQLKALQRAYSDMDAPVSPYPAGVDLDPLHSSGTPSGDPDILQPDPGGLTTPGDRV